MEMSRHFMSNPEIRLVSAPQIALSSNACFYHDENLDMLSDIPGFCLSLDHLSYNPTSTEPYQSKAETFSSTTRTMTPATPMYPVYPKSVERLSSRSRTATPGTPAYPSLDPAVKEEQSPKTVVSSPTSPNTKKAPFQADFKPHTKEQQKYDKRIKAQALQIPSDIMKE